MRAVRAIAKSPGHLSRESNVELCKRLCIELPVEAVKLRMQRKALEAKTDLVCSIRCSIREIPVL